MPKTNEKTINAKAKEAVFSDEKKNAKTLDELKERIKKKLDDIERNFYSIGVDLLRVNLIAKNFRKWVLDNTSLDVSTAYALMRLVKRDKELLDSKSYQDAKGTICFSKLTRLLKYPVEFVEKLDFSKEYDVPGGAKKFTLVDAPRELFQEILEHEHKMFKAHESGDAGADSAEFPTDTMIILQAKTKLDRMVTDLKTLFTVLSEVTLTPDVSANVEKTITELESILTETKQIQEVGDKILESLKGKPSAKAAVA